MDLVSIKNVLGLQKGFFKWTWFQIKKLKMDLVSNKKI